MRIISIEATPGELAESEELCRLIAEISNADGPVVVPSVIDDVPGFDRTWDHLPAEIEQFVERYCRREQRVRAEKIFLNEAIERYGVRLDPWEASSRYVKVYSRERHDKGAVVYLTPSSGRLNFRLPPGEADNYVHAFVPDRNRAADAYKVGLVLDSNEAVEEALKLLGKAIAVVNSWNPSAS